MYFNFELNRFSTFWENGQKPSEPSKKGCFLKSRDVFEKSLKSHMKRKIDLWHELDFSKASKMAFHRQLSGFLTIFSKSAQSISFKIELKY